MEFMRFVTIVHVSICTCVGCDPGDESVDVGGDEMPATNFPSVDIEKETTAVSIECSSSSSDYGYFSSAIVFGHELSILMFLKWYSILEFIHLLWSFFFIRFYSNL